MTTLGKDGAVNSRARQSSDGDIGLREIIAFE
jgi:hypothetical protein